MQENVLHYLRINRYFFTSSTRLQKVIWIKQAIISLLPKFIANFTTTISFFHLHNSFISQKITLSREIYLIKNNKPMTNFKQLEENNKTIMCQISSAKIQ